MGKIYEGLFKISLETKKALHEKDPWRHTEFRLCRYADIELMAWCAWLRDMRDMQKGLILVTGLWKIKIKKNLSRRIDLAK